MKTTAPSPDGNGDYELDPVFVHAGREAVVVLGLFVLFAVYTLGVSYMLGRMTAPVGNQITEASLTLGMPTWVFWGIFVPWIAANGVTAWYCFIFMKRDVLDGASEIPAESEIATPDGAQGGSAT